MSNAYFSSFQGNLAAFATGPLGLNLNRAERTLLRSFTDSRRVSIAVDDDVDNVPLEISVALWRMLCFPGSTTIVAVPTEGYRLLWMAQASKTIREASRGIALEVEQGPRWMRRRAGGDSWNVFVHTPSEFAPSRDEAPGRSPVTVILSDFDRLPGCRSRDEMALCQNENDLLVLTHAPGSFRGRVQA